MVLHPLPLDRRHVLANKFRNPECTDYKRVAGKIRDLLAQIREGTPLEQADNWIRTRHYTAKRLEIERLSGTALPMDQCYINLAIIEQPSQASNRPKENSERDTATQPSPFSLPARLKVETVEKSVRVQLPALFDPRKRGHVETKPRRILIRGRPGVGKTTLCKKIVHEFTRGTWSKWTKLFDRVLWVPLRHLKRKERLQHAGYNFFHLFCHEYFSTNGGEGLAQALSDTLDTTKSSRTLFLLDGLDEAQDIGNQRDMSHFLKELLDQPNVIITSRPSGRLPSGLAAIDIELETIGFYPNQVNEYLERVVPKQATELQSFLRDHLLVQDLVRVPIQLDALCFTWNKGFEKFDTMTTIYRAIEDGLWKKDILRLEKKLDGKPVTEFQIQDSASSEIKNLVKDEIDILEGFAFTGLHNDVIDFEPGHRDIISTHFKPPTMTLLAKTLPHLSFLRTSDLSSEWRNQSYHFLHLTYQEYFAARYFVRQWQAGKPLICPSLGNRERQECQEIETSNFLRKHKYTARFDVFWRFIAGLLGLEGKGEQFFTMIEDKPRDLLGPTHQRLVMHCLSEASTEMPLRGSLEETLKEWLLFECRFTHHARLASEVEFPERALLDALREEPVQRAILRGLANRPTLPSSIVNLLVSWLEDGESIALKREVWQAVLGVLRAQSSLSDEHLAAVVARLGDEDWHIRQAALVVLGAQSSLSDEPLAAIVACLEDEAWYIRRATLVALGAQSSLSDEPLAAVVARLEDEDCDVRRAALGVLRAQSSLSDEHLAAVVVRLEDKDWHVRRAASDVLGAQSSLSDEPLAAVVVRLEDEDRSIWHAALDVLRAQSSLSNEHLAAVVARLGDKDWHVRQAALGVLRAQSSLSDEHLAAVVARLEDEDRSIWHTALDVLQAQSSLSNEYLAAVVACLGDKDWHVRQAALGVLRAQSSLSDEHLAAVVARLEDEDWRIRHTALVVLGAQSSLSNEHLAAVVARLEDEDWRIRQAALGILGAQSSLSDEPLAAVVTCLEDEDWDVRQAASDVLRAQSSLSDELLMALSLLLESEKSGSLAETVLRGHWKFYSALLLGQSMRSLLTFLLRCSFEEQWSWYVEDGVFYINGPDEIRNHSIDNMEMFKDMVIRSWLQGIPSKREKIW